MQTLIDTGFLLANIYTRDRNHQRALEAMRELRGERVIAAPVLVEAFYMTVVRVNYTAAIALFGRITSAGFTIVDLTAEDYTRMTEIMRNYQDAAFDFTDVAQMAIAERMNITRIFTFDRRDFSVFRPKHTPFLELLP